MVHDSDKNKFNSREQLAQKVVCRLLRLIARLLYVRLLECDLWHAVDECAGAIALCNGHNSES